MTTANTPEAPDWRALAEDALDLWQTHLTSLANDPRAKEEMAKMVSPMNQMFANWTAMMGKTGRTQADGQNAEPSSDDSPPDPAAETAAAAAAAAAGGDADGRPADPVAQSAAGASVTARDRDVVQLTLRLATVERRLGTLETLVASMAAKELTREQERAAAARRARREEPEAAQE